MAAAERPWEALEGVRPAPGQAPPEVKVWEIDTPVTWDRYGRKVARVRRRVKCSSAKAAASARTALIVEVLEKANAIAPEEELPTRTASRVVASRAKLTVEDYARKHYLPWLSEEEGSALTYEQRESALRCHVYVAVGTVRLVDAVKPEAIRAVRRRAEDKLGTRASRNRVMTAYSALLSHAADPMRAPEGEPLIIKPRLPFFKRERLQRGQQAAHVGKYKLGTERHKRCGRDSAIKMLQTARGMADSDWWLVFLGFGLRCAMRRGEAVAITWDDVDWKANRVYVHSHICPKEGHIEGIKNGVPGWSPLEPELRGALERMSLRPRRCEYVLTNAVGKRWLDVRAGVSRKYAELRGKALGADKANGNYHECRHEVLSHLADRGVGVERLQVLARHQRPDQTYGYISPDSLGIQALSDLMGYEEDESPRPPSLEGHSLTVVEGGKQAIG